MPDVTFSAAALVAAQQRGQREDEDKAAAAAAEPVASAPTPAVPAKEPTYIKVKP